MSKFLTWLLTGNENDHHYQRRWFEPYVRAIIFPGVLYWPVVWWLVG